MTEVRSEEDLDEPEEYYGELVRATRWMDGTEPIDTAYGRLSRLGWLKLERERITADPARYAMVIRKNGHFALFVN